MKSKSYKHKETNTSINRLDLHSRFSEDSIEFVDREYEKEIINSLGLSGKKNYYDSSSYDYYGQDYN